MLWIDPLHALRRGHSTYSTLAVQGYAAIFRFSSTLAFQGTWVFSIYSSAHVPKIGRLVNLVFFWGFPSEQRLRRPLSSGINHHWDHCSTSCSHLSRHPHCLSRLPFPL